MRIYFQNYSMNFIGTLKEVTGIKKALEKEKLKISDFTVQSKDKNEAVLTISALKPTLYSILVNHVPYIELTASIKEKENDKVNN